MSVGSAPRARPRIAREQLGLVVPVYLLAFIALLDVNVVVIALPSMKSDLGMSNAAQQWVVSSYTLCLSALALSAGALGDRYGRRLVFLVGVVLFTAGSAVCAAATSSGLLVAGRFVQGAGAAIALPGSLSLIAQSFTDLEQRARVMAGWATVVSVAGVTGPVLGGVLVDTFGWPSIFLVNLPLGVVALVLGSRSIPESSDPGHADLDLAGQALGIGWLGGLSYGLVNAGAHGWSAPATVVPIAAAVIGFVAFLVVELRQQRPMLPIRMFANLRFTAPNTVAFVFGFSGFTLTVFLPTFLQDVQHHDAVRAGFMLLPVAVVGLFVPAVAARWVARAGFCGPLVSGMLLLVAALGLLLLVGPDSGYWLLAILLALVGAAYGLTATPSNAAVMAAADRERTGTVAATINAIRQTGTSLGVALLGTLLASQITHLDGRSFEQAYTDGLHLVAVVSATIAVAAAVLVLLTMRGDGAAQRPRPERAAPAKASART
ncbi:MFS transporter [Parafrankia sp. FMc2]|uniref:MFS transporter n=1 Tax=Parafrankia sp. FMc2 TaxID=3233196 RepID=UPI0034D49A35